MLVSLPSLQSKPPQPSTKENLNSESGGDEDFSEHLDAKSVQTSEPKNTDSTETENQSARSDETTGEDRDTSTESESNTDAETELMPVKQQSELLDTQKVLNELRFTQLVKSQELEITLPVGNGDILMPPAENGDELMLANVKLATANLNLDGGETKLFSTGSQPAVIGNGLVRDTNLFKEKSAKPGSALPANLQTSIAVKPNTGAQNLLAQPDASVQQNIALPQERSSSVDADLEKVIGALEMKTSAPSGSVDGATQKLTVDAPVPSMSQPSQTLVRAIQENSNWTKVLSTSSVQLDETQKIDGTVLQKLDIHLNLIALGKLDVKLRLQQGELQVQIRTDSEQAYKMLSVDQDVLANTIKGLGYKVDTIAISGPRSEGGFQMNSNSQSEGQQQTAEQHYQNEKSGQRSDREFMPMKDADNDTPSPQSDVEGSATGANVI